MKRYKTLILDAGSIKRLVGIKDAMRGVEQAFKCFGEGKVKMPSKVYIHLDRYKGDFRAMPAYVESFKNCIVKWVNVHPENRRKGLPTVMAIIILSNPRNGFPLCIMDGTYATSLRTGAAGGVAAKYLARKDSHRIAFIGCGVQARTQLLALNELFEIKEVKVWDINRMEAVHFVKDMNYLKGIDMVISNNVESCVKDSDIVVTTTPSRKPLVKLEWLREGVHINAIGADAKGKKELDTKILKKAKIVVDAWEQASCSGEINIPLAKGELSKKNIYAEIGEIVAGRKRARTKKSEITVFDSTGLAIQDVAIANIIYKKAVRSNKGRYVSFIY